MENEFEMNLIKELIFFLGYKLNKPRNATKILATQTLNQNISHPKP